MSKSLMMKIEMMCFFAPTVQAFTAYHYKNQSNEVESYSLLEPDARLASDGNGETETTGEIVQMKQDQIIPVFF